jgi:hypothetical protein
MLLNHRIVSMKLGKPYQVLCFTCGAQHLYRPHAPGEAPVPSGSRASGGGGASQAPASRGPTRAAQALMAREQQWEKAIAGRAVTDFKPYMVTATFQEGDLVRHKKFGDGVVTRVIDGAKVEVLFRDEPRTLAHGMR